MYRELFFEYCALSNNNYHIFKQILLFKNIFIIIFIYFLIIDNLQTNIHYVA